MKLLFGYIQLLYGEFLALQCCLPDETKEFSQNSGGNLRILLVILWSTESILQLSVSRRVYYWCFKLGQTFKIVPST